MFPYEGPGDSKGVQGEFMYWSVASMISQSIGGVVHTSYMIHEYVYLINPVWY